MENKIVNYVDIDCCQITLSLLPCLCGSHLLRGIYVNDKCAVQCKICGRVGWGFEHTIDAAAHWCQAYHKKKEASERARLFLSQNYLIFDTETTGLDENAEIIEISVIDSLGTVLLDSLIKPSKPIPNEATAIHGITNEMVESAPKWNDVVENIKALFNGQNVTAYNLIFDSRLLFQTSIINCTSIPYIYTARNDCVMLTYADFYGEASKHGNKRQSLSNAAVQQNVIIKGQVHRALADCFTTLGVIKGMAAWQGGQS